MDTTTWDDDRIRATVKERSSKSPITGLDEVGWIVQLHDLGPADGRAAKPVLLFDSEGVHGTSGVFHDDQAAQSFADRRLAGELRRQRETEAERHRRKEALSERQRDLWAEEHRQKEIAKAANKAAKAADEQARKLAEEAQDPAIALSCNPAEDGWSLWVAPCWTDGTQDGDPRQLVIEGSGMLGPRKLADDKTPAKPKAGMYPLLDQDAAEEIIADAERRKGKRARKSKPAPTLPPPDHVADSAGLPLKKGSRVAFDVQGGDGRYETITGTVTQILGLDASGVHRVEIEGERGEPYEALATECTRVPEPDEPTEDWDDPEAA